MAFGVAAAAEALVATLGGRFSTEAGINVDAGRQDVERWFLAATLFGTRISAKLALRTYRVLDAAGVRTIDDVQRRTWEELVGLLDQGGYARYDFRTARRLLELAAAVVARHPEGIARFGAACGDRLRVEAALDALPGWGPVTVAAFLRELRGVWPAARLPLDPRAARAAQHIQLGRRPGPLTIAGLSKIAGSARLDVRDLEAALVRLDLVHHRTYERCNAAAGTACLQLTGWPPIRAA